MRFLIDNNLSIGLPAALQALGHDSVHVRDLGMGDASDAAIRDRAIEDGRYIISGDRDFGTLLALHKADSPTVIYLRGNLPRRPEPLAKLINENLGPQEDRLRQGCIVVLEPGRVRVRRLPIT